MERQAGLGRSLNDVIESLTPAEPDAPHARGADVIDITPQLTRLVLDVQDLRDRVGRLEAAAHTKGGSKKGAKNLKKPKKPQAKRNESGGEKTKKS